MNFAKIPLLINMINIREISVLNSNRTLSTLLSTWDYFMLQTELEGSKIFPNDKLKSAKYKPVVSVPDSKKVL
jgi:hypothetical protein